MGSQRDVCVSPASTRSSLTGALISNRRMIRKPSFSGPRKISPDSGNITKWSHWIPTFKRSCMLFWPRPRGNLWAEQAEVGGRKSDIRCRRTEIDSLAGRAPMKLHFLSPSPRRRPGSSFFSLDSGFRRRFSSYAVTSRRNDGGGDSFLLRAFSG